MDWIGPRWLADLLTVAVGVLTVAAARRIWLKRGEFSDRNRPGLDVRG